MLTSKPITKLVFLDIETRPKHETFAELPAKLKLIFSQQYDWLIEQTAHRHYLDAVLTDKKKADHELCFSMAQEEVYKEKAVLSPEFAGIICISAGMILEDYTFKCVSFCTESEKELLTVFLANKKSFIHQDKGSTNEKYIVGYELKDFDIPFLSRRIMYNGLELPPVLEVGGYKPWELDFLIDPKEHLKFAGTTYPSLEHLCTIMNIETGLDKFGIKPEDLFKLHSSGKYEEIKSYCEQNIFALAQCYMRLIRSKDCPTGILQTLTKAK